MRTNNRNKAREKHGNHVRHFAVVSLCFFFLLLFRCSSVPRASVSHYIAFHYPIYSLVHLVVPMVHFLATSCICTYIFFFFCAFGFNLNSFLRSAKLSRVFFLAIVEHDFNLMCIHATRLTRVRSAVLYIPLFAVVAFASFASFARFYCSRFVNVRYIPSN